MTELALERQSVEEVELFQGFLAFSPGPLPKSKATENQSHSARSCTLSEEGLDVGWGGGVAVESRTQSVNSTMGHPTLDRSVLVGVKLLRKDLQHPSRGGGVWAGFDMEGAREGVPPFLPGGGSRPIQMGAPGTSLEGRGGLDPPSKLTQARIILGFVDGKRPFQAKMVGK